MTKGPGMQLNTIDFNAQLDTSFRIIVAYQSMTDNFIARLDAKIGKDQFHSAFGASTPIEPIPGSKFLPEDDLITPKSGIEQCINLKVSKTELIRALKELLADIDN